MKKDLHPSEYRPVVVKDLNTGDTFLTRSTAKTGETIKWEDGKEYPLLSVHISSASHPFYTGQEKLLDVEGRVDKFHARQKAAADRREARSNKAKKAAKQSEETKDEIKQKVGGGSHQGKAAKKIAKEAEK